jgi:hypothetical protein
MARSAVRTDGERGMVGRYVVRNSIFQYTNDLSGRNGGGGDNKGNRPPVEAGGVSVGLTCPGYELKP